MLLVLVESPFKANPVRVKSIMRCGYSASQAVQMDEQNNLVYLAQCMRECIARGEAPFASHLLYTQFLDDNIPAERAQGIDCGLAWGQKADKTIVYVDLGISNGMHYGIARAKADGRDIEYRQLGQGVVEYSAELGIGARPQDNGVGVCAEVNTFYGLRPQ